MSRPDDISKFVHLLKYKVTPDLLQIYGMAKNICLAAKLSANYEDSTTVKEKACIDAIFTDAEEDIEKFSSMDWG